MFRMLVCLFLSTIMSASASTLSFVAGQNRDPHSTPIIAQTTDQGQSWSLQDITGLPKTGYFQTGSCSDAICIAAGYTFDYINAALLVQTVDGGLHWDSVQLPGEFNTYIFYGSSCSKDICIAVGTDNTHSVLAQTTDRGVSWSLVDLSEIMTGFLVDAKCLDKFCVAVGQHGIIQTEDNGTTWVRKDAAGGGFASVDCTSELCVAVGSVKSLAAPFNLHSRPLIVQTDHKRSKWESQSPANQKLSGTLTSVHCSINKCVAVGHNHDMPLIAEMTQEQPRWTFQTMTESQSGTLASVDCNNQYCFAAGYTLLSDRNGSWQPEELSVDDGTLNMVNCTDDFCFVAGESHGAPLLLQTTQNNSWGAMYIESMPPNGEFSVAKSGL